MARVRRNRSPNDDLVEAAENCLPHILMFYKRFEKKRPVILLDLQRMMLAADYEEASAKNKIVVFVRDNENRRLASMLFDYE